MSTPQASYRVQGGYLYAVWKIGERVKRQKTDIKAEYTRESGRRLLKKELVDQIRQMAEELLKAELEERKNAAAALLAQCRRGGAENVSLTVEQYLFGVRAEDDSWIIPPLRIPPGAKDKRRYHSPRLENDRRVIYQRFCDACGNVELRALKREHLQKFFDELRQSVSHSTCKVYYAYLHQVFEMAEKEHKISESPLRHLVLSNEEPEKDNQPRTYFTWEQLKNIVRNFPAPYADLALISFCSMGAPLGSVYQLRWDQVDWESNTMTLACENKRREPIRAIMPKILRQRLEARYQVREADECYVIPELASKRTANLSRDFKTYIERHVFTDAEREELRKRREESEGRRAVRLKLCFLSLRQSYMALLMGEPLAALKMMMNRLIGQSCTETRAACHHLAAEAVVQQYIADTIDAHLM